MLEPTATAGAAMTSQGAAAGLMSDNKVSSATAAAYANSAAAANLLSQAQNNSAAAYPHLMASRVFYVPFSFNPSFFMLEAMHLLKLVRTHPTLKMPKARVYPLYL